MPFEHLKKIIYFGQEAIVGCDGRCHKAWGNQNRPKVQLSDDEDDVAWLADDEFGAAPLDPGTYEGGQAKPCTSDDILNKWCVRECERCCINRCGTAPVEENLVPKDWSQRVYNIPRVEVKG